MATIQRRVTRTGHVRYRAQVRIKNQPWVSATFHKRSDATKWARETESAQITGVYSPPQAQLRYRFSDAVDRYRREVLPTKSTDEQKRQLFQLRRWHDLQNCANCCFAQAIRTVNYFAEPYEGEGKLVAVEIDGEMIRRMPTKAFDDSPLPYQKCLKRVLKKASALQGHPESLRLTHPQYSQLMSDFDHLCVIQDGEFEGINDLTLLVEEFEETLYDLISIYEITGNGLDGPEELELRYRDGLEQVEIDIVRAFINRRLEGEQDGVDYMV